MKVELEDSSSLADRVYLALETAILSGHIGMGERLLEADLAEKLSVSRAPLREALRRLHFEGLATTVPRKGTYVISPSYQDALDLLQVRQQLECLTARLAAERMSDAAIKGIFDGLERIEKAFAKNRRKGYPRHDIDFHEAVIIGSGNARAMQLLNGMYRQLRLIREMSGSSGRRAALALQEHLKIAEAIRARDPAAAEEAMRQHLEASASSILSTLKSADNESRIVD
nr:GntR family transcriptional regulator [Acuticoccus mangrovi]